MVIHREALSLPFFRGWKIRAKEFYKHAKIKNGLKVQEFFFDKNHPYDLAEKKTDHLEDLYRVTNMEVLITEDVVTFTANYKIGITDLQFILLFALSKTLSETFAKNS